MKVKKIMTAKVKTCLPNASLTAAAELMRENHCGVLPVMNAESKVVGVITDRDICLALGGGKQPASQIKVSAVMSGKVYHCSPGDDVKDALNTMRKKRVRRLPVVNRDGVLKGICSIDDVLLHVGRASGGKQGKISYKEVVRAFQGVCKPRSPELPLTKALAAA